MSRLRFSMPGLVSLGRLGQADVQFRPRRIGAQERNFSAVRAGQFPRRAQAQAAAGHTLVAADAVETLEQVRDALWRNAFAGVAHCQFDRTVNRPRRKSDSTTSHVVLDRVLDEVLGDHSDKNAIRLERKALSGPPILQ